MITQLLKFYLLSACSITQYFHVFHVSKQIHVEWIEIINTMNKGSKGKISKLLKYAFSENVNIDSQQCKIFNQLFCELHEFRIRSSSLAIYDCCRQYKNKYIICFHLQAQTYL